MNSYWLQCFCLIMFYRRLSWFIMFSSFNINTIISGYNVYKDGHTDRLSTKMVMVND